MATFELQHALEMPFKTVEESYEWNQLWCSNVFVFDEERSKRFTYFWDESVAPRGPEQKACCLLRYNLLNLPKNTKKIIVYSKDDQFNRNLNLTLILKKNVRHLAIVITRDNRTAIFHSRA